MPDKGPPLTKQFLSYLEIEKGLSGNTLRSYRADLRHLTQYAYEAKKPIQSLTAADLRGWIAQSSREGLSASTVRRMASAARGFYLFLVLDDHIDRLPTDDLNTPPPASYLPHVLTEAEIELLLAAPDTTTRDGIRDRAILELMYAAGLRVSELITLSQQSVDLHTGIVTCTGKGAKERAIPIGRSAAKAIERYIATKELPRAVHLPLFMHRGAHVTRQYIWTIIKHYGTLAGIKRISPHTLRHTFATHLFQRGAETKDVQMLMGHSYIQTTQIYTHLTERYVRQAFDAHHPRAYSR